MLRLDKSAFCAKPSYAPNTFDDIVIIDVTGCICALCLCYYTVCHFVSVTSFFFLLGVGEEYDVI